MHHTIIEFIPSMSDGGAETLVKDYALLLTKAGHRVIVVTKYPPKNMANGKLLTENHIEVLPIFPAVTFVNQVKKKLFSWWYIPRRLKKLVKEVHPDVLHVHMDVLQYVKPISKALKGVKLFYTCHSLPESFFSGARRVERDAADYLIEHNQLRLIALHHDMAKELNEMFSVDDAVVIRNGVDFDRFRNVPETKTEIRRGVGIPKSAFVLGHVGRFSEEKNHLFLIDVFAEVCKRESNAFLLLVGSGALRREVEDKLNAMGLSGRYLILEHRTDIPQLLKAMDVFVFPSRFEGLSVTLVEAQAAGKRCIVSDRVNEESLLSERTVTMSIEDIPQHWADAILDESIMGVAHGNLDDFDMNQEIRRLEGLYFG